MNKRCGVLLLCRKAAWQRVLSPCTPRRPRRAGLSPSSAPGARGPCTAPPAAQASDARGRGFRRSRTLLIALALGLCGQAAVFAGAAVGKPAPDFTLTDSTGQSRSLSQWKGKVVVLEWSNHECPFVRKHYGSGTMQRLQATYTGHGVVWLTIVSSALGKQGHVSPDQADALTRDRGASPTAVLLDPDGTVGRRYGAKTTPHLFLIDASGMLVYAGAIDDRPSTDRSDIAGATNYVQQALDELLAGRRVSIRSTKPYGCSVKY